MLVLTRKENETIRIGDDITITLIRVKGGSVRVGIDAPSEVKILRGELEPCDAEPLPESVEAYGVPVKPGQSRPRLPMAGTVLPLRGEKVQRKHTAAPAGINTTAQSVSA